MSEPPGHIQAPQHSHTEVPSGRGFCHHLREAKMRVREERKDGLKGPHLPTQQTPPSFTQDSLSPVMPCGFSARVNPVLLWGLEFHGQAGRGEPGTTDNMSHLSIRESWPCATLVTRSLSAEFWVLGKQGPRYIRHRHRRLSAMFYWEQTILKLDSGSPRSIFNVKGSMAG